MIISDKGTVRLSGKTADVLADLAAVVHGLHEVLTKEIGKEEAKKVILEVVEDAFKTEEELDAEIEKLTSAMQQTANEVEAALVKILLGRRGI